MKLSVLMDTQGESRRDDWSPPLWSLRCDGSLLPLWSLRRGTCVRYHGYLVTHGKCIYFLAGGKLMETKLCYERGLCLLPFNQKSFGVLLQMGLLLCFLVSWKFVGKEVWGMRWQAAWDRAHNLEMRDVRLLKIC